MLVALRWLQEWIDLPDSAEALAEQLTMSGLEVDSVEHTGPDLSAIRVGLVVEREQHPNADRLSLCQVDLGEDEPVPIVCGAPNVAAGQKVAVAVPGTTLPGGLKLKKSKIRGVTSLGMICSTQELGLGEDHEGILVLDADAPVGSPLASVLQAGETVLEVAIMPNRGDCTSMLGIAREVRAHYGGTLRVPECTPVEGSRAAEQDIRIEIDDAEGCHRYVGRVVRGLRVGSSPPWLVERLEAAGLRSINNLVDITNLVLMEFGQPLHAFDLNALRGGVVRVRSAEDGESIRTLDGEERKLERGDLVIADADGAIALAGIMGGADSEVGEGTTDVLIESAHFDPRRVRRTARRLNLSTDASYRFEREVDRERVARAADRAARLMAELAGGEVSAGVVEALGEAPDVTEEIALSSERTNRLLGTDISDQSMVETLARLEITRVGERGGEQVFRIPSFRNDLHLPQDLIEEVARIQGFDAIPTHAQVAALQSGAEPAEWRVSQTCCDALVAEGLVEVQSFPFLDPADLDRLGLEAEDPRRQTLGILNPIVESDSRMRSTLVPSLLRIARDNLARQAEEIRLFEVARTFRSVEPGELPEERLVATLLLTEPTEKRLWDGTEAVPLFFVAKGIVERLLAALGRELRFAGEGNEPYLHPGASCEIASSKGRVGVMGELHPACASRFDIPSLGALVELDLSALAEMPTDQLKYSEVSRFPLMRRDLAVLLDRDQQAGEILEAIRQKAGAHLSEVEIFDRYDGEGVPEGRISLAFRLTFQRSDRTLTDAEITKSTDRVVQMLAKRFGGELR